MVAATEGYAMWKWARRDWQKPMKNFMAFYCVEGLNKDNVDVRV